MICYPLRNFPSSSSSMPIEDYFNALWLRNLTNLTPYSIHIFWKICFVTSVWGNGQCILGYILQHESNSAFSLQNFLVLIYFDCEYLRWSLTTFNKLVKGDILYQKALLFAYMKLHYFKVMYCFKALLNTTDQVACFEACDAWFIYAVAFIFKMMLVGVLHRKMIEWGSVHVPIVLLKWKTFPPSVLLSIIYGAANFGKEANLDNEKCMVIGAIFAATDYVCMLQVLNQDETPLLYIFVFGEGVVNDVTSVVFFNAIQNFDLEQLDHQYQNFWAAQIVAQGGSGVNSNVMRVQYPNWRSGRHETCAVNPSAQVVLPYSLVSLFARVVSTTSSLHFTHWDPGGWWSLVHWRSQYAWEALYQDENLGLSSSEVEETDVGGFLSNFIVFII